MHPFHTTLIVSSQLVYLCTHTDVPLTPEDTDALRKLLLEEGIDQVLEESDFYVVQQQLRDGGHLELAANLRTRLDRGMYTLTQCVYCSNALIISCIGRYYLTPPPCSDL